MKQGFLWVSAAADLMLYRSLQPPTAQSTLLVLPAAVLLLCLWCTLLHRCGIQAGRNKLYPAMLWGYLLVSCLQLQTLVEKIWEGRVGQLLLPAAVFLWAMLLPAGTMHSLKASAGVLLAGALMMGAVFIAAAAPNMRIEYLITQSGQEYRQSILWAAGTFLLPLPEYVMLTDPALELKEKRIWAFPAALCMAQAGLRLAVELVFGKTAGSLSLAGYEAARVGVLFALKRAETLQVVFWLCLMIWRLRFVSCLLQQRTREKAPALMPPCAVGILPLYAAAAALPELRIWIYGAFYAITALAAIVALAGGRRSWDAKNR